MRFFLLFVCGCLGCFLTGCGSSDGPFPHQQEIVKAEDHLLKLELTQARVILDGLAKKQDLPPKYLEVSVKTFLAQFEFQRALQQVLDWEVKTESSQTELQRTILLAWLRTFTEYKDRNIKFEAIKALGELKDQASKDLIMQYFLEESKTIRLAVCYAMACLGDEQRAIPYLMERARYGSSTGKVMACLLLAELKKRDLIGEYRVMLDDPDDAIRSLGLAILGELKAVEATEQVKQIYEVASNPRLKLLAAQTLVRFGEPSYRDILLSAFQNEATKTEAALILADLDEAQAKSWLNENYNSLDLDSQFAWLKIRIKSGEKQEAMDALKEKLKSLVGDSIEKKMSMELFSKLAGPEDKGPILAQLSSPFEEVQVIAVKALLQLLKVKS